MVAKIDRGQNLMGILSYNQQKVDKENGSVLFTHKVPDTVDGSHSVSDFVRAFEPYLVANRKTEKPVLHISLNPDPNDKVSDTKFREIAQDYMQKMGYGDQPFIVFKHTDIDRTHIHIVSVCVDEEGRKISDKFEHSRSMKVCRELEKKYGLKAAPGNKQSQNQKMFCPVDYRKGDLKSQLAAVVRYLPKHYRFQTWGEYNALLSLFNITSERVEGELHGVHRQGLVYFALDENEKKASNPFKASLFGKHAGYAQLQQHMERSKAQLKTSDVKPEIRKAVMTAMQSATDELSFKERLTKQGINAVVRRNAEGRIYGITFIDHASKTVWNGSRLGKECSAGIFHDWWNNGRGPNTNTQQSGIMPSKSPSPLEPTTGVPHGLFDFLSDHVPDLDYGLAESISGIGWLLPGAQVEDYEEQEFAYRIRKKKKRRRKQ